MIVSALLGAGTSLPWPAGVGSGEILLAPALDIGPCLGLPAGEGLPTAGPALTLETSWSKEGVTLPGGERLAGFLLAHHYA